VEAGVAGGEGLPSGWLEFIGGVIIAVVAGLGSGLYFRGKMEGEIQAINKSVEDLSADVDAAKTAQVIACRLQKEAILDELRREVLGIVRLAVAESSLRHLEQMGEIRSNIATIVALNGEMQKDVEGIYKRLNRRSSDLPHPWERREVDGEH
jgi:hypothetical protein